MPDLSDVDTGIYLDASALAKLYVPERESDQLDAFLRGRRGLYMSELAITEVLSAVARRKREGLLTASQASQIRGALLSDADSGSFRRLDLSPAAHRLAETLLLQIESVALRTLDALHIAMALEAKTTHVATYDARMRAAVVQAGLLSVNP